jgi:hypothetical protein
MRVAQVAVWSAGSKGNAVGDGARLSSPRLRGRWPTKSDGGGLLEEQKQERDLGSLLVTAVPYQKLVATVLCLFEAVKGRFA